MELLGLDKPALLFPAISLLYLGYTNRFLSTGQLIRSLGANIEKGKSSFVIEQIANLKRRMELIKFMQFFGILSLIFCIFSMFFLFIDMFYIGAGSFITSMILMLFSLGTCLYEVLISTDALNLELKGMMKED